MDLVQCCLIQYTVSLVLLFVIVIANRHTLLPLIAHQHILLRHEIFYPSIYCSYLILITPHTLIQDGLYHVLVIVFLLNVHVALDVKLSVKPSA